MAFVRSSGSVGGAIAEEDRRWPQQMRSVVRAGLSRWNRPDVTEAAELLVTELVTNALRHGRGDVRVRVYIATGRVRIEVRDGSHEIPVPRNATPVDEDGRGLLLVTAIADDWGVSPDGTTTWCSLTLQGGTTT
ncbi:ATP-binding protein [Streptomyces aurantiacus]|uniref:ATP-binding protein n=1 Tax=Streptomyces aurantiacus TaxID=47760 RepID=UPI0027D9296A|nr:ATP-binding protein [Streptomyces aurantiacus]